MSRGGNKIKLKNYGLRKEIQRGSILDDIFPELAGSEDEQIRKELTKHLKEGVEGYMPAGDSSDYRRWLDWLEKQGESSDQIHYWTEEEIEPIISDYLRGAEHYGGMIGRLRCLKPKSLERQRETYTKRDVDNAYIEGMASAKRELEKQGEQKSQRMISAEAKEAMYGKPAWSEEDEERLSDAIFFVREYQIPTRDKRLLNAAKETEDWLKSLKQRMGR